MKIHALAGLLLVAGCTSPQSAPIPVRGDLSSLAGEWRGSYESPALGRGGSIIFTLVSGEEHAHGDVVMVPSGTTSRLRPAEGMNAAAPAQTLTIQFVRAIGDQVTGTLSPYTDPECNCTATASFTGRLDGNAIRGTFVMRRASGSAQGTWAVSRHN